MVLSLIGLLTFSSLTYADTEENNTNQDAYNTYEAPEENNLDNDNQIQEENNFNQNNYNESEGEYYDNGYSDEQYNDDYYDGSYSEDADNNDNYNEGYDDNAYNEEVSEEEEEIYNEEPVEPEPEPELEPEPEEPVEVYEDPEPEPQQEEEKEIEINQVETEYVQVSGRVTDVEDEPIDDIKLFLNSEDVSLEAETNEDGNFTFEEVPSGNYELAIVEAEGYQIDEESVKTFEVGSRNKSGLMFTLETDEEDEEVVSPPSRVEATDGTASSPNSLSPMDWTLISIGAIFLLTGIVIFILKRLRA